MIFIGGWAYAALRAVRTLPSRAVRRIETGLHAAQVNGVRVLPRIVLSWRGRGGAQGGVLALDRRCTHLGCLVSHDADRGELVCPCHGSRFDTQGGLLRGPATKPLIQLKTTQGVGGEIVVDVTG